MPLADRGPLAFVVLLAVLGFAACHRAPPPPPVDPVAAFALRVVDAARSADGLGPELVDAELVERLRRLQLVLRTTMDTWEPAKLLDVYAGNAGPDRNYPVADRPKMQRERAARGIGATLSGRCTATRWDQAREGRVKYLVTPPEGHLPDEIVRGQAQAAEALAHAEAARVQCERGDAGMLFVKDSAGRYRLVDIFPSQRQVITVHPDDPSMK